MVSPRLGTGSSAGEPVLLHGDLILFVIEARRLPNMDLFSEHLHRLLSACHLPFPTCGALRPNKRHRHHRHHRHPKIITSDPYVTACIAGATVARTRVISNSEDPKWYEQFRIPLAHCATALVLHVKDNDVFGAQTMGTVSIPTSRIATGEKIQGWFPILGPNGKPPKAGTALHLAIQYTPVEKKPEYLHGIAGDPKVQGVRDAYFPLRRGGSVTLYQDAHVGEGDLPVVNLEKGAVFKHEKCWEDICHAILEAHHLIYVVGWSIYHKVKLVREPTRPIPSTGELTLGELLKFKAKKGVRVSMLVWDDKTSHDKFFFKTGGVMHTHDEETRKFFKNSSVNCVLSPRYGSNKLSIVKHYVVGTLFTHHQKCILVDTQAFGNKRKITAFTGGLDLCDGRYDTPAHRLFRDLDTVYQNDIHNPTFATGIKGPRQPWHDLHCKIEGPAAYDILKNFEQRWRKATKWRRKLSKCHDDALIKLERISWIQGPKSSASEGHPSLWVSREEDPENWHVQVFRSIDSGSVKGFPSNVHEALKMNLVCQKNLVIDKSIHTAYVKAIRSAQHFIYIENQYFVGSSYAWPSYKNSGADNLIPMELALKVASKIRAKERFAVYVVMPMWPEGDPNSGPVQEILYWQAQTIQMMYDIIAKELKNMNIENAHPQDYLNFYCLGKREEVTKDNWQLYSQYLEKSSGNLSQKFRRFMIYVHAKGMIVDDEYVLVGSANINQRSMSGSRDTEIAMGAYQPHHTWNKHKRHPCGQVYGYRMSLWAEHLGMLEDRFQEPNSLECLRFVNKIAEENWSRYIADEMTPLTGHFLRYPIKVEENGKIGHFPGQEQFPDVGGRILGSLSALPNAITM